MRAVSVGEKKIGRGYPCFIIAELSANHNQDLERAKRIINAAKMAGADAVKFQTYTADTITLPCSNKYFSINEGPWAGNTLYELYKKASTPWEWQSELKVYAESLGLICFSTPFDATAVDYLEQIGVQVYKIASFELIDIPLIEYVARKGKPVIISTGMASLADIESAVNVVRESGNNDIILLKCTSEYPARIEDMNLSTIKVLESLFSIPIGLSDHSMNNAVTAAAVACGACVIEKHITEYRNDGGPDANFSLEPDEFKSMVDTVRAVEAALGTPSFCPGIGEKKNLMFRKSIFISNPIKKGELFSQENIRVVRPGYGLHPMHYKEILGKMAAVDIDFGTPLEWHHIASI